MVEKQKSNSKKKKVKSHAHRSNNNNLYGNNSFNGRISNKNMSNSFNHSRNDNYNYKSQNTVSKFHRSSLCTNSGQRNRASLSDCDQRNRTSLSNCDQKNRASLSNCDLRNNISSPNSGINSKKQVQNEFHCTGYVTNDLRAHIEKHISENKRVTVYIE